MGSKKLWRYKKQKNKKKKTHTPAPEAEKWMVKPTLVFVRLKHRDHHFEASRMFSSLLRLSLGRLEEEAEGAKEPAKLRRCWITAPVLRSSGSCTSPSAYSRLRPVRPTFEEDA